jgi:hypothetical protein
MKARIAHRNCIRKWKHIPLLHESLAILCLLLGIGCAQVPKESAALSTTVGRDITEVHRSHRELAIILYDRIKNDINRFVDDVYAPYQIKKLLQSDREDFNRGEPESLFSALDAAIKQPDNAEIQKEAMQAMDIFVQVVREEVEAYRTDKLAPIIAQEKEVLSAIDRSYNQIHYANSIVTGHLASIVEVHDAQEKLLNEFGIEGLREDVGQKVSTTSSSISDFVEGTKRLDGTVDEIEKNIKKLTEELDILIGKKETEEE